MPWEPHDPVSYILHVALGFIAFAAAIIALSTAKGSTKHIKAGKTFAYLMIVVALTTMVFMLENFLPLALVMALATLYLIPSAMLAFHRQFSGYKAASVLLALIPLLLGLFAAIQFVRFWSTQQTILLGPIILAVTFLTLAIQDFIMLRKPTSSANYWVRRHLVRMLLAFTFAAMAVVRIGINVGLTLEQTVIYPMLIAFIAIVYFYRKYPVPKEQGG